MTANGWLQIVLYLAVIFAVTKPVGIFMTRVFNREQTFLDPVLRPVERLLYRLTRVDEDHEMRWTEYAFAMLLFSGVSMLVLYGIQRLQLILPLNPQKLAAWSRSGVQHGGILHHQHQLAELWRRDHHELSHADGGPRISQFRFRRGGHSAGNRFHSRHRAARKKTIGNFWVDLTRTSLWVLLPACVVYALILVSQGVVQNFRPYDTAKLVETQQVQRLGADGKASVRTASR